MGSDPDFDPDRLFQALLDNHVAFIVIGGIARVLHGSAHPTLDSDILVRRERANLGRLSAALNRIGARLLAGDRPLEVEADEERLWLGMNFSWSTEAGRVDTFIEVAGGFRYETVIGESQEVVTDAGPVRTASLSQLMAMKAPLRRAKDIRDMEEIEELLKLQDESRKDVSESDV